MRLSLAQARRGLIVIVLPLIAVIALAGCGTPTAAGPALSDAWVRPPMGADRPAAGYLTIVGGTDEDTLIGARSPIASMVEIHETTADANGMTGMHPIDRLAVPAGATVALEPGGYHLMLMGVTGELTIGSTVEITLTFEQAGEIVVSATVQAS